MRNKQNHIEQEHLEQDDVEQNKKRQDEQYLENVNFKNRQSLDEI